MAKQLRSVVRLDKVKSVYTGNNYSIRITQEMENGFVVKLGDIEANNRDVHEMVVPTAGDSIVLIANPAIIYDNARLGSDQEKYYYMEKDEVVRGYEIAPHDVFSVSELGIDGTAVVGEYVVSGDGVKLVPSDTPATEGFCAKVVRKEAVGDALALNVTHEPTNYVVLEVLSN